jgi:hypothetical protein
VADRCVLADGGRRWAGTAALVDGGDLLGADDGRRGLRGSGGGGAARAGVAWGAWPGAGPRGALGRGGMARSVGGGATWGGGGAARAGARPVARGRGRRHSGRAWLGAATLGGRG